MISSVFGLEQTASLEAKLTRNNVIKRVMLEMIIIQIIKMPISGGEMFSKCLFVLAGYPERGKPAQANC